MKNLRTLLTIASAVAVTGLASSCKHMECTTGSGKQATEKRTVVDFNKIEIAGGFEVTLVQDSSSAVTITADDNILKSIKTSVDGGKLRIYTKENFCSTGQTTVVIGFRNLEDLNVSGGVEIASRGHINVKDISFNLSGATKLDLDMNAGRVSTDASGSTEIKLKGQATSHAISTSGNSELTALDFVVSKYDIETSGNSEAKINVLRELNVHTSGASDIEYRGNPTKVNNDESGASSIKKVN